MKIHTKNTNNFKDFILEDSFGRVASFPFSKGSNSAMVIFPSFLRFYATFFEESNDVLKCRDQQDRPTFTTLSDEL